MRLINTSNLQANPASNTMVFGEAGVGKTTQCMNYQKAFGNGLILSMESGLSSIEGSGITAAPITSLEEYRSARNEIMLNNFHYLKQNGFNWLAIDSLTELSDRLYEEAVKKADGNGFKVWEIYKSEMISNLKFLRDLPLHTLIIALADDKTAANGLKTTSPLIAGGSVAKQLVGYVDNAWGLDVYSEQQVDTKGQPITVMKRRIITSNWNGWSCKTRARQGVSIPTVVDNFSDVARMIKRLAQLSQQVSQQTSQPTNEGENQNV